MIDGMDQPAAVAEARRPSRWCDPGLAVTLALLLVGSFVALSIDVPRTLRGIKGDESTYVLMALSLAYDGDLVYTDGVDLDRFFEIYDGGPEGVFLKQGVRSFWEVNGDFPFVHRDTYPDARDDRLYFGKAFASALFAAPFVRIAGINGLLWFHVILLVSVLYCGYRFLQGRTPALVALAWVAVFLFVSEAPIYAVWLSSDFFNFALVFFAYFLWFYKDVAGPPTTPVGHWLRRPGVDLVAAVVLGVAIFSKPVPTPLFIAAPVFYLWSQRRFRQGWMVGFLAAGIAVALLSANAMVSGEFNYQGGLDRKYLTGEFPFDGSDTPFGELGENVATGAVVVEDPLPLSGYLTLLARNVWYFLVGRHFGFVPFLFPGVVATLLFWRARSTARSWQWVALATAVVSAVGLALYMPFTWSGGGGPTGNRYYLATYALFFFLTPAMRGFAPTVVALLGGMFFIGQILINPLVSAKESYLAPAQGALRLLPVELTMVLDLPINLDGPRARVLHSNDPRVQLYFLDYNAWLPEPPGIWITGGGDEAHIIVRNRLELESLTVTARSPVANRVSVQVGRASARLPLEPDVEGSVTLLPTGVYSRDSWAYLLRVSVEDGFVPRLLDGASADGRFLGAAIRLEAVEVSP